MLQLDENNRSLRLGHAQLVERKVDTAALLAKFASTAYVQVLEDAENRAMLATGRVGELETEVQEAFLAPYPAMR